MHIRKIKDIFDWIQTFHVHLAEIYDRLAEGHDRDRVGLLLHYLAEHERALSNAVQHYMEDHIHTELDLPYDPNFELPCDTDELAQAIKAVDTAEVLRLSLQYHDELLSVYEALAERAPNPQVQALFEGMLKHEVREKLRTVRDAGRLEDI